MAQDDLYLEFIKKVTDGKKPEEMQQILQELMNLSGANLMSAILEYLEIEDFEALDAISDEKLREAELDRRFKARTGVTLDEFLDRVKDSISKNYLFPELAPINVPVASVPPQNP
ncbi:hypothetical protein A3D03_01650 [Candidatus Gottesmanbacteria bacterium RIFCSPHIGHO2_02_FULL_40_13]|uniref:Uncharacterized protein n=1 Tax=Candidatus Gottesmanbacteria bacterium RIFCSPHIGHO2_02_FULL_40_13 TaxID=1798384 RepID=A0A1F6A7A9_9BACT|nr:MAG: hypothetical protein A3D03_01650 [Candidatus Gottesmanbacteria bacterium RIFCSPHIGHO2_02_FULL_40_13]